MLQILLCLELHAGPACGSGVLPETSNYDLCRPDFATILAALMVDGLGSQEFSLDFDLAS